ncbi:MAG: uroporphyrinogen-III C-methyltransferase [Pseudomonadota bacterium]
MKTELGKVYLIGAGPGDPGLLTLKGKACIEMADVVVYDYLAAPALLNFARPDAEIIYVGKKGGDHTLSQDKINDLLADKGAQGLIVARLKGGDPFIFGRGGEEAEVLISRGIPFEIVPGVTSAIAAPAYAGIPLTHREHASSVSLVTGHEDPLKNESSIRWDTLAQSGATLVFLMGVKNLVSIRDNLIKHGKSPDTPVALVRWGTTPRQETVTGTLTTIVGNVEKARLKPPAVIVVGSVVTLRDTMQWFENRPLFGKTIVVTRARNQASDLVSRLTALGADCIELPTIAIAPPDNNKPLVQAIQDIASFQWLVFTSVNGVKFFFDTLFELKKDVRALGHLKFACIGPVTRQELLKYGISTDILPDNYMAESVVQAFSGQDVQGKRILLPRAREARTVLPEELTAMGALVHEVTAYKTVQVEDGRDRIVHLLENKHIHAVTFTSSSTVKNFMNLIGADQFSRLMNGVTTACIGPITAETLSRLGTTPDITAETFTIPGLVQAMTDFFAAGRTRQ